MNVTNFLTSSFILFQGVCGFQESADVTDDSPTFTASYFFLLKTYHDEYYHLVSKNVWRQQFTKVSRSYEYHLLWYQSSKTY